MQLKPPFAISSRLMPAVRVGNAWISLDLGSITRDGRTRYKVWIDLPDGSEYEIDDLRSGVGRGSVQDGMASLLGFLSAAAESYDYRQRTGRAGENEDLFALAIVEWASANSDEISLLQLEIEETPDLVTD